MGRSFENSSATTPDTRDKKNLDKIKRLYIKFTEHGIQRLKDTKLPKYNKDKVENNGSKERLLNKKKYSQLASYFCFNSDNTNFFLLALTIQGYDILGKPSATKYSIQLFVTLKTELTANKLNPNLVMLGFQRVQLITYPLPGNLSLHKEILFVQQ